MWRLVPIAGLLLPDLALAHDVEVLAAEGARHASLGPVVAADRAVGALARSRP